MPLSPAESPSFKALFSFIRKSEDLNKPEINAVRQYLWLINAHPELIAFILICEQVRKIIGILDMAGCIPKTIHFLRDWMSMLEWFINQEDRLAIEVGPKISMRPHSEKDNPVIGNNAGRHHLYTVLCNDHHLGALRDNFSYLVGYYLLSHILVMRKFTTERSYYSYAGEEHIPIPDPKSHYTASLGLRNLSELDLSLLTDLEQKHTPRSLMNYCRDWVELVQSSTFHEDEKISPDVLGTRIKSYGYFVGKAFNVRKWANKGGTTSNQPSGKEWKAKFRLSGFLITSEEERDDDPGSQPAQTFLNNSTSPYYRIKHRGLHPDETSDDDEALVLVRYDCKIDKKGGGRTAFAALGHARHTSMRNQLLPWRQNQLSMKQLSNLLKFCHDRFVLLRDKGNWSEDDQLEAELITLVHIMLWTSCPLNKALSIKIQRSEPTSVKKIELYLHKDLSSAPDWVLPAHEPAYASEVPEDDACTHARVGMIFLPDVRRSSYFLLETDKRKRQPLFKKRKEYRQHLKAFLDSSGEKIRISQLENYLFHAIVQSTQDIALATEITNKTHHLSGVKVFYSTIATDTIRQTYADVVVKITDQIYEALGEDFNPMRSGKESNPGHVGSRNFPKGEAVKDAIARLKQEINELSETGLASQDRFIAYHNAYTLYTLMFSTFATGFRAVRSPFIPLRRINLRRGIAALSDKEKKTEKNKARLVWMPKGLISQVTHYEKHCSIIQTFWKDRFKKVKQKTDDCFFITDNLIRETVTPYLYVEKLEHLLRIPANSNRKFMRMKLKEKGCSEEIIEAFMGHAYYGQESWGQFSSFPFVDYVSILAPPLVSILEQELEFKPIPSRLAKAI